MLGSMARMRKKDTNGKNGGKGEKRALAIEKTGS